MDQTNYKIYKAENTMNGYVYIGVTTKTINERKKDHECKAKNNTGYKFQEAISTYGADSFKWEQIDTATNPNELAEKETAYIYQYKSNVLGYNSDTGGSIPKNVYQYNISNGLLVNTYKSLGDAGRVYNITKQCLSKICLSVNKTFKGYYWSYTYKEPFQPSTDLRCKSVVQYSSTLKALDTFKSVAEASVLTKVNKSSIAKVCRGERNTAGGYVWKYQ